ncbi:hypothetical protein ACFL1G_06270 [Planctomycetota bacterium]
MNPLNDEQKQLVFDFCIGLTTEKQTSEAEELISSNKIAAKIYSELKSALEPLDKLQVESCPDDLSEKTVMLLEEEAQAGQGRLEELLLAEETREVRVKNPFWRNAGKLLATAAVILFFSLLFIPSTNYLRQKSWQQKCKMQLSNIFRGLDNYMSENNGRLPAIATFAGQPWWKVGDQGNENYSNTRRLWLLVKNDYVQYKNFACPGNKNSRALNYVISGLDKHYDFPTRDHITYSLRISCPATKIQQTSGDHALIADLNPLFEELPEDYSGQLKRKLTDQLAKRNSINHNRRGQNVLFCNGAVKFIKTRHTNITEDDIFTLRDTEIYTGVEVPSSEEDAFLAP